MLLETLGVLLLVLALGVEVSSHVGVPLGLCASALGCWLASWLLQGARLPTPVAESR